VLLPPDDPVDQLDDLRVDGRLAAADGDDGRAALVDGLEALLERQAVLQVARPALGPDWRMALVLVARVASER